MSQLGLFIWGSENMARLVNISRPAQHAVSLSATSTQKGCATTDCTARAPACLAVVPLPRRFCRLQQIRSSWQEHPNNNNAVMRLSAECRDLLDKMFDTNQVGVAAVLLGRVRGVGWLAGCLWTSPSQQHRHPCVCASAAAFASAPALTVSVPHTVFPLFACVAVLRSCPVLQDSRITIDGIIRHPWLNKRLPPK